MFVGIGAFRDAFCHRCGITGSRIEFLMNQPMSKLVSCRKAEPSLCFATEQAGIQYNCSTLYEDQLISLFIHIVDGNIVIIEYGIESCYDATLQRINRGHDFATARKAVEMTAGRGLDVGAHFILGLPGETRQMMQDSCALINSLPLRSVKFHQLQIVKGTKMEHEYADRPEDFERFGLDEYLDFFVDMLERLRPDLFIERFVGEVPPRFVNETPWGLIRNAELLRMLEKRLEERDTWQGRLLECI